MDRNYGDVTGTELELCERAFVVRQNGRVEPLPKKGSDDASRNSQEECTRENTTQVMSGRSGGLRRAREGKKRRQIRDGDADTREKGGGGMTATKAEGVGGADRMGVRCGINDCTRHDVTEHVMMRNTASSRLWTQTRECVTSLQQLTVGVSRVTEIPKVRFLSLCWRGPKGPLYRYDLFEFYLDDAIRYVN